jgi:hypothetical protein
VQSASPDTRPGLRTPGWLNILLTESIGDAVAAVGSDDGLDELNWSVRFEGREIFVLGTPPVGAAEPRALCEGWASSLHLTAGAHDANERVIAWSLHEPPWMIEISMLTA